MISDVTLFFLAEWDVFQGGRAALVVFVEHFFSSVVIFLEACWSCDFNSFVVDLDDYGSWRHGGVPFCSGGGIC